jgi:hypothetical protein
MNEHRRKPRRKPDRAIDVQDVMTESLVGRIGNLSETGMLIQASQPLVDDALYQFRFTLNDRSGTRHACEVGAHHLWSEPAATPGQSWVGFRFIDVAPEDARCIGEWATADANAR